MSIVTPVGLEDRRRSFARRMLVAAGVIIGLSSGALVIALIVFANNTAEVLRGYLALVGLLIGLQAINLAAGMYVVPENSPTRSRRPPRRPPPNWPADMFELEDRVSLAKVSQFDYASRLRPLIRELAAQRLAAHLQIDLKRQPAAARDRLGEALWEEVEDAEDTTDVRDPRDAPGPNVQRLRDLIESLESI